MSTLPDYNLIDSPTSSSRSQNITSHHNIDDEIATTLDTSYSGNSTLQDIEKNHFTEWESVAPKHQQTDLQAYMAFFKCFVGAGVLFLASGFKNGGLTASLFTFIITTLLSTWCMLKMGECKNRIVEEFKNGNKYSLLDNQVVITFGIVGQCAIGDLGRYIIDISIGLSQLCFCATYLVFVGKNLSNVITQFNDCISIMPNIGWIWICLPLLIPITFLRQLQKFQLAIVISDVCIVGGLIFLYIRNIMLLSTDGLGPGIIQFDPVGYWSFLGTAIYALEGTAFVLPIEHSMKNRENFPRVTLISGLFVGALYTSFGLIGYLTFGENAESIITLNLKAINNKDISVAVLQLVYVVALLLTYPVQMYPATRIIESYIFVKEVKSSWLTTKKNILRVFLCLITGLFATVGGSSFDNFVSLVGGMMCVPLTFVYPAWFHMKICGDLLDQRSKIGNYMLLFVGIVGSVACTVVSIYQWVQGSASSIDNCTI